jgi:L-lysine exporter family protein LysE/ArgO
MRRGCYGGQADGMTLAAFGTGFALGGTLIVAIGAQNAFVLRQGLRREHVGAVVAFCAGSDIVLMGAGVAGLGGALRAAPAWTTAMLWGGALFLAVYGLRALRRAWQPAALVAAPDHAPMALAAVLAQAAAFTLLNPHVYLDTVLLVGAVGSQQAAGAARAWFLIGACLASVTWFVTLGFGARWLAPWFARPRAWQALDGVIGVTMLALAAMLLLKA